MEIERIERIQKVESLKKDIVLAQKKLIELGKKKATTGIIAKRIRIHDDLSYFKREIRKIKIKSRRPIPILIEEINKLSKNLKRFDYVELDRYIAPSYLRFDNSFNVESIMNKIEYIGEEELKIEKTLKIKHDNFSKSLDVRLYKPVVPMVINTNGVFEEAPIEEMKYFGNSLEHSIGARYLKENFKTIFREFYGEMQIDYDFESVYLTFAVHSHSFIIENLPYKKILNENEIAVELKYDIHTFLSVKDYKELEVKVCEKYHVFYAILIKISYEDKFYVKR